MRKGRLFVVNPQHFLPMIQSIDPTSSRQATVS